MIDRLTGTTLIATTFFAMLVEWHGARIFAYVAALGIIIFLILATPRVAWSRRVFVFAGVALFLAALATRSDWRAITEAGLATSAFIAAFFTALACLRDASATSPSVETCGRFLAEQRPGRRYLALTIGGHLFSLVLNYGAISLLGTLAEASAQREPNLEIRGHRIRRMLLAIQRGFVSTLAWSPLSFSIAISTALVPGASWAKAIAPCLVSSLLLAGIGWALDTIFKPRLSTPRPPRASPSGSWASILPMLVLLAILVTIIGGLHIVTGVRAVGVVMLAVPLIALGWVAMQNQGRGPLKQAASRASAYVAKLHVYRSELILLVMAGFIGTIGSRLLSPVVGASGFDLTALPGWLILIALVWVIPLNGLIGMNPILSVSLMAPLLPSAADMGVTPTAMIVALTAGWALGGASSPYTATTLLVGAIARVSPWRVGLKWNGAYTLICGIALSVWVAIFALG
ncbi:MAG: hypothetical protein WBP94_19875 [Rhodomicrobiaceae bacterium]